MAATGHRWTLDENSRFAAMYHARSPRRAFDDAFPHLTEGSYRGRIVKLQLHRQPDPSRVRGLPINHPAVQAGRSLFPSQLRTAANAPSILTPGSWQKKLGSRVTKGAFRGFPIYSLTLEERATCPSACHHWQTCMGNALHWSWRLKHGSDLEARLERELGGLQNRHPSGFLIRLHILGDFYSVEYVQKWKRWLKRFPALHVFGYSAWDRSTEIGQAVHLLNWTSDRWFVRQSSIEAGPNRAITLWEWRPEMRAELATKEIIVCPVEIGRTKDCGSCGLCFSQTAYFKTIAFIAHGPHRRGA